MIQSLPILKKEFSNGREALSVRVNQNTAPALIANALNLPDFSRVFILSGGAGGMSDEVYLRLTTLFNAVAEIVVQTRGLVIDGGTQSGVMQLMGQALAQTGKSAPHIGVVPAQAEAGPDGLQAEDILDPNHTNFVLVDGNEWGDEVNTMYGLAAHLSGGVPSVAMLVNGGGISLREVEQNVRQKRPIIVVSGSGRLADEITDAMRWPNGQTRERIKAVTQNGRLILLELSSSPANLVKILQEHLQC